VALEDEAEGALLLQPIDLGAQLGAERVVIDLVQEDVEFVRIMRSRYRPGS
jgi:hypothetical protein